MKKEGLLLFVICFAFNFVALSQVGIVACYPFNGNAQNQVGTLHNGTVNGATLVNDRFGIQNHAYSYDGVNDYIQIPHHNDLNFGVNNDFSISFWLKAPINQVNSSITNNDIITKWVDNGGSNSGYPYTIRFVNQTASSPFTNGQLRAVRWDKNCSNLSADQTTVTLNDNQFHHVVYLKDGNTLKLYVDNVLNQTFTDFSVCSTINTDPLYFGTRGGFQNPNFFTGVIDDVVIYNFAVNDSIINCLYTTIELPCTCDALVSSVNQNDLDKFNVTVYPNPVEDYLQLSWNTNTPDDFQVTLLDLSGRTIKTYFNAIQIETKQLPAGVYFLKIEQDSFFTSKKFVKF